MLRITRIIIHNFKCFSSDQKFELQNDITGIVGVNGSGKSVLLELLGIFSKSISKWILEEHQYNRYKEGDRKGKEKGVTAFFELYPSSDLERNIEKNNKASKDPSIEYEIMAFTPFSFKAVLYYGKKPSLTVDNITTKGWEVWKRVYYSLFSEIKDAPEFPSLDEKLTEDLKWLLTLAPLVFGIKFDRNYLYPKMHLRVNELNYMRTGLIYLSLLRRRIDEKKQIRSKENNKKFVHLEELLAETNENELNLIYSEITNLIVKIQPTPYESSPLSDKNKILEYFNSITNDFLYFPMLVRIVNLLEDGWSKQALQEKIYLGESFDFSDTWNSLVFESVCLSKKWDFYENGISFTKLEIATKSDTAAYDSQITLENIGEILTNWMQKILGKSQNLSVQVFHPDKNEDKCTLRIFRGSKSLDLKYKSEGIQQIIYLMIEINELLNAKRGSQIVLLDELGSSLHPYAQANLLTVLRELAKNSKTQIIYTTHSPFMVDEKHYNEIRVIGIDESNIPTIGRAEIGNFQELFQKSWYAPLAYALGFELMRRLSPYRRNLIVEGKSDKYFLEIFSSWFNGKEEGSGLENMQIEYMGGEGNRNYYIHILTAYGFKFVMLLDKDKQGKDGEKVKRQKEQGIPIVFCADVLDESQRAAEIEDIFSISDYLKLVAKTYDFVEFEHIEEKIKSYGEGNEKIKERLRHLFSKEYGNKEDFSHIKVAKKFDNIKNTIGLEWFDNRTKGQFKKLVRRIKEENNKNGTTLENS